MPLTTKDPDEQLAEVLRLRFTEKKSTRAIVRESGLSMRRVRKLIASMQKPKPATRKYSSIVDPYADQIHALLQDSASIRAPAVLDRLRASGYQGGISVVRDHLRRLRPKPAKEAFLTRHYGPGSMLQVDWADFGFTLPGCARRVSAFVAALVFSRYLFIIFTLSQALGTFLRCMDLALSFFRGATLVDVFDNMKTVVLDRTADSVRFHPRFAQYAATRGFAIRACTPRRPTEKPYVERPIGFVRTRFWPGRRFTDLFDLNVQAERWRDDTANNRVHEQTGKVPSLVFEHEERKTLQPIPDRFFDTDDLSTSTVSKTFRVRFDRNDYSVPWRLLGQTVLVRGNAQQVSVFLAQKRVAVHNRSWDVGKDILDPSHESGLLEQKPRGALSGLPDALTGLGETTTKYFHILAANGRSLRKERERLVLLCELYGDSATASAMDDVMTTGHVGAEYVEYVLRHKKGLLPQAPPLKLGSALDEIRFDEPDLAPYDAPRKTLDPEKT